MHSHEVDEGELDLPILQSLQPGPFGNLRKVGLELFSVCVGTAAIGISDSKRLNRADDDRNALGKVLWPDLLYLADIEHGHPSIERIVYRRCGRDARGS